MGGFNTINTIDQNADMMQRVKQNADALVMDAGTRASFERMRKERRSQEAGLSAAKRLKDEYKNHGVDVDATMDEEGNMRWKQPNDMQERLRASASDMSKKPIFKANLGMQAGDKRYDQSVQGKSLQTVEDGSVAGVNKEQLRLVQDKESANEDKSESKAEQSNESKPSVYAGKAGVMEPMAGKREVRTSLKQETQAKAAGRVFGNGSQDEETFSKILGEKGSQAGADTNRSSSSNISVNKSQSTSTGGGSVEPVSTTSQYKEAGFRDAGPEMAAHRLRSQMANIQGDISRGMGHLDGASGEERVAHDDLENVKGRYAGLNQTLNPEAGAKIDGGRVTAPTNSQSTSDGKSVGKSNSSGQGSAALDKPSTVFTSDAISGAGGLPGNFVMKHNTKTGKSSLEPTANGEPSLIPAATLQGMLKGRINDHTFGSMEMDDVKGLIKKGDIEIDKNGNGYIKRAIPANTPHRSAWMSKLKTEHNRSKESSQYKINADNAAAKNTMLQFQQNGQR